MKVPDKYIYKPAGIVPRRIVKIASLKTWLMFLGAQREYSRVTGFTLAKNPCLNGLRKRRQNMMLKMMMQLDGGKPMPFSS